jgi:hypothetical protein
MEFISHRINTIDELKNVPPNCGVEIDIRDWGNNLILAHDPFKDGEDFEDYIKHYHHGTMILNIKSERIEHRVLELIRKYNIKDYFFLDSSFPMIQLLSNEGEDNIALRFSEYEGLDTIIKMKNRVKWVWVDCFSRLPITTQSFALLKNNGFKLCLVSPELQGQEEKIEVYKSYLESEQIVFDAICCKTYAIERWKKTS